MATKVKIELKTRLNDGIYRCYGGGITETVAVWNAGPRNLLSAAKKAKAVIRTNVRCYGDIGAGSTWLEIGGERVDAHTTESLCYPRQPWDLESPTASAKRTLQDIVSGNARRRKEVEDEEERAECARDYETYFAAKREAA